MYTKITGIEYDSAISGIGNRVDFIKAINIHTRFRIILNALLPFRKRV